MPDVEFIPLGTLSSDDAGGTTLDFARTRARWQALPDGWMSAKDMREAVMQVCHIPAYDHGGGEAALWALGDFLEVRGNGAAREYRAVETPPEPMSPAQIFEAEAARRAEVERERIEREDQARARVRHEQAQPFFENQRRVHRELTDEYSTPRVEALERRLAQLEAQLAQHGELEAAAVSTPTATATPTASEAPAESRLERARRFMFGDMEPAEIERLREQEEADGEDNE